MPGELRVLATYRNIPVETPRFEPEILP